MRWPTREEGRQLLVRLGVPERDLSAVLEQYPDDGTRPWWWDMLCDAHGRLVARMGRPGKVEMLPADAPELGPVQPFFGIYVLLSALPDVLEWHSRRGIPTAVSWATLEDLGRQVRIYHRFYGRSGFDEFDWVSRHFRGLVFQLGRLQFEPAALEEEWRSDPELIASAGAGGRVLALHVPEGGPLLPELCDDALTRAPGFFARHFPEEEYRVATCESWLLDGQLSEYLPPEANIVRFQRRFTMLPSCAVGNRAVLRFVFYKNEAALDQLPQDTRLKRAIVRHLEAGRDWFVRAGWLRLGPSKASPNGFAELGGTSREHPEVPVRPAG